MSLSRVRQPADAVLTTKPSGQDGGAERTRSAVWVVLGSSGQWSDWTQWAVCVCADEQTAKDRVGYLSSQIRQMWQERPDYPDDDGDDDTEKRYREWRVAKDALDPDSDDYDQPSYRATKVPFLVADGALERQEPDASPTNDPNPSKPAQP